MSRIKVLVVDDSIFMRKAIESMLKDESDIEVIGMARNGQEAVELTAKLAPDVITMDIEMPIMDGIKALENIMKQNPTPVIMVSSLTQEGADATLRALDLGAVDFIPKDPNSFGGRGIDRELKDKIRKFAKNKNMMNLLSQSVRGLSGLFGAETTRGATTAQRATSAPEQKSTSGYSFKMTAPFMAKPTSHISGSQYLTASKSGPKRVVAIGTSTGGPQSLQRVIPFLPKDLGVPVVLTQHMPPNFTASLASRLNSISNLEVVEAQGKEKLEPNVVYIAKGGIHLIFKKIGASVYTDLSPEPSTCFNIPSVDVMVSSIAEIYGKDCLGVIMTGMGSDGTKGLTELKNMYHGTIIAQDEPSCIVYGMPRSVIESGIADEIVPLDEISKRIVFHVK